MIMKYERKGGMVDEVDELDGFGGVCILGLLQYLAKKPISFPDDDPAAPSSDWDMGTERN